MRATCSFRVIWGIGDGALDPALAECRDEREDLDGLKKSFVFRINIFKGLPFESESGRLDDMVRKI